MPSSLFFNFHLLILACQLSLVAHVKLGLSKAATRKVVYKMEIQYNNVFFFSLCGPVPNHPWPDTGPWPGW